MNLQNKLNKKKYVRQIQQKKYVLGIVLQQKQNIQQFERKKLMQTDIQYSSTNINMYHNYKKLSYTQRNDLNQV